MTVPVRPADTAPLRRAVENATRAPSVHNTQPWRFVVRDGLLELHADRTRQLRVLDPRGRQLTLSCGCALFNARAALSAFDVEVLRLPDRTRRDLLAVVVPGAPAVRPTAYALWLAALDRCVPARRTNRREFTDQPLPPGLERRLVDGVRSEGAHLMPVQRPAERVAVTALTQLADRIEGLDAAYRAEMRAWTGTDGRRRDGVLATTTARTRPDQHPELPLRNFDMHGGAGLPAHEYARMRGTVLVLGTDRDDPAAWLRAGEAVERLLLEVTLAGLSASLLSQPVEVSRTRVALRRELAVRWWPQVLVRVGWAAQVPTSARRRLDDVLVEL